MAPERRTPWLILALFVAALVGVGLLLGLSRNEPTDDERASTTPTLAPSPATIQRAKGYETAHRFARAFAAYLSSGNAAKLKGASLSPELYRTIAGTPSRRSGDEGSSIYAPRDEKIVEHGKTGLLLTATLASSDVAVPLTAELEPTPGGWRIVSMTSSDGA